MKLYIPTELRMAAKEVNSGTSVVLNTRDLLGWFRVARRGRLVVRQVRLALSRVGLKTEPDFKSSCLDGRIKLVSRARAAKSRVADKACVTAGVCREGFESATQDPAFRIGRLPAANRTPKTIGPDETLIRAITIMRQENISQLPVMTGKRTVVGVISMKSIVSRLLFGKLTGRVGDCMEKAETVEDQDLPLLRAVDLVTRNGSILIQAKDKTIQGIVTSSDLLKAIGSIVRPFMLLEEIEKQFRAFVQGGGFSIDELAAAKSDVDDGREIKEISDLTLGEYIRLLDRPANWRRLGLSIDRASFVSKMHDVRRIRNEVMHFCAGGLGDDDLNILEKTSWFFRELWEIRAQQGAAA